MTAFAQRKQERIAAGNKKYEFKVIASYPFDGEVLATFKSKREAEDFAHKQIGSVVGNTQAWSALAARHRNAPVSSGQKFSVERVEAAQ